SARTSTTGSLWLAATGSRGNGRSLREVGSGEKAGKICVEITAFLFLSFFWRWGMKIRGAVLFLFFLASLLVAVPLLAQEAVLSGRVTQEDGPPIANATVSIPALGLTATTDKDGRYRLTVPAESVKGQTVDVRVVAPGLQSKTAKVTLSAGSLTQD